MTVLWEREERTGMRFARKHVVCTWLCVCVCVCFASCMQTGARACEVYACLHERTHTCVCVCVWITLFIETDIAENADINLKLVTGVTYDISKKKKKKKK